MTRPISIFFLRISAIIVLAATALTLTGCIEDDFTSSPEAQPTFSCDTLRLGEVHTLDGTPTFRFTVYNRNDKAITISDISLREGTDDKMFRLNVDGQSGSRFTAVDIRPNDSIFVFVEATIPESGSEGLVKIIRHIDFTANTRTSTVVLRADAQDVVRCEALEITADTYWNDRRPYLISDTLRVAEGKTLTIGAGSRLRFTSEAAIVVNGTLKVEGTEADSVSMTGYRTGYVASTIPYELMSGQWGGIYFTPTSRDNTISYSSIRNSSDGIVLYGIDSGEEPALTVRNSKIRNTTSYIIDATHANVNLIGCELTDASLGILWLQGGKHIINHCTIANYYLFTVIGGPAVQFRHIDPDSDDESGLPYGSASITNSIIYGIGDELSHGDLTGTSVTLRRCLLKSEGSDDDNFIGCIWGEDPLYLTDRPSYYFDYRLAEDSPAIGVADTSLDIYGYVDADLGCYPYKPTK